MSSRAICNLSRFTRHVVFFHSLFSSFFKKIIIKKNTTQQHEQQHLWDPFLTLPFIFSPYKKSTGTVCLHLKQTSHPGSLLCWTWTGRFSPCPYPSKSISITNKECVSICNEFLCCLATFHCQVFHLKVFIFIFHPIRTCLFN